MSPMLTTRATHPPPTNSLTMHRRLVRQEFAKNKQKVYKFKNKIQTFFQNRFLTFETLAIGSFTNSDQSMWFRVRQEGTDTHTEFVNYRRNGPRAD